MPLHCRSKHPTEELDVSFAQKELERLGHSTEGHQRKTWCVSFVVRDESVAVWTRSNEAKKAVFSVLDVRARAFGHFSGPDLAVTGS